jgi:hypothetical protein
MDDGMPLLAGAGNFTGAGAKRTNATLAASWEVTSVDLACMVAAPLAAVAMAAVFLRCIWKPPLKPQQQSSTNANDDDVQMVLFDPAHGFTDGNTYEDDSQTDTTGGCADAAAATAALNDNNSPNANSLDGCIVLLPGQAAGDYGAIATWTTTFDMFFFAFMVISLIGLLVGTQLAHPELWSKGIFWGLLGIKFGVMMCVQLST